MQLRRLWAPFDALLLAGRYLPSTLKGREDDYDDQKENLRLPDFATAASAFPYAALSKSARRL